MQAFLRKYINPIVPLYAILPLIACFTLNTMVYYGAKIINSSRYHYDFTTDFDRSIPLIPSFVFIYFVCYAFWIINYIMIGRISREHCLRFVFADMTSRVVCAIFFILIPTTNIRPEIIGSGLSDNLMRYLYVIDSPENLFPSIHCLVSWFCYIGIRGQKKVPLWYRIFSCVFAILVCISTQVTKQHYFMDVIGGLAIAEITYYIAGKTECYKGLANFFDKISCALFGPENIKLSESEHEIVKE